MIAKNKSYIPIAMIEDEIKVLDDLCKKQGMSRTAILRQALRLYQLVHVRMQGGERVYFEGDDGKRSEFFVLF